REGSDPPSSRASPPLAARAHAALRPVWPQAGGDRARDRLRPAPAHPRDPAHLGRAPPRPPNGEPAVHAPCREGPAAGPPLLPQPSPLGQGGAEPEPPRVRALPRLGSRLVRVACELLATTARIGEVPRVSSRHGAVRGRRPASHPPRTAAPAREGPSGENAR